MGPLLNRRATVRPPELTVIEGLHRREPQVPRWAVALIAVIGVVAVTTGVIATRGAGDIEDRVDTVTVERDAAAGQATDLARKVVAACAAGGGTSAELERVGACEQAQQVKVQPIPGPRGAQGVPGAAGAQGIQGPQGIPGVQGEKGDPGVQGEKGDPGATGSQGVQGIQGVPGDPGDPGDRGSAGQSIVGPQGIPGIQGEKGDPGADGADGSECRSGTTAREVEYADGSTGIGCVFDDRPPVSRPNRPDPTDDEDTTPPQSDPGNATLTATPTATPGE